MKWRIPLIYAIIITTLLTACVNPSEKSSKISKKDKAPETLTKVSEGIDEIFKSVDSIMEIAKLSESEYQALRTQKDKKKEKSQQGYQSSGGGQEGEGNQGDGQGQSGQGGQQQQQEQEDIMTKDEEIFLKWREVDKKLEEIHTSWNQYEAENKEKGATQQKGEELKTNLNDFTVAVANREIRDIIDAGSKVHNSLAVFFDMYKDEISGDLSRVKYSAYRAYLYAQEGNIEEASKLLTSAEEHISRVRKNLEEDKVKDLEKLSLSIADMKLALNKNNMELLKIKLDIIVENIKVLKG
ncbi:MAG TPA: hypothetical protein GXX53_06545 [Tissierellia bacterium]|nr:hypothetical protein [Tissierellia bacterium]